MEGQIVAKVKAFKVGQTQRNYFLTGLKMAYKTDIEIAREANKKPIQEIENPQGRPKLNLQ